MANDELSTLNTTLFCSVNLTRSREHWWTEWAPAWGYIPATGAEEEDTLWRCPNISRIIWQVSYPCLLIGQGMILHKWSLVYWGTVRGCPPLPSRLMKYSLRGYVRFLLKNQPGPIPFVFLRISIQRINLAVRENQDLLFTTGTFTKRFFWLFSLCHAIV